MEKVTLYTESSFGLGIVKIRAHLVGHGTMERYAQYRNVPWIHYRKFRGRKVLRHIVSGSRPYTLMVKGWDTPEPDSIYDPSTSQENGDVVITQARYSSFDDGWKTDFDMIIDQNNCEILLDYRSTKVPGNGAWRTQ